jgi:hypothetical protein
LLWLGRDFAKEDRRKALRFSAFCDYAAFNEGFDYAASNDGCDCAASNDGECEALRMRRAAGGSGAAPGPRPHHRELCSKASKESKVGTRRGRHPFQGS